MVKEDQERNKERVKSEDARKGQGYALANGAGNVFVKRGERGLEWDQGVRVRQGEAVHAMQSGPGVGGRFGAEDQNEEGVGFRK